MPKAGDVFLKKAENHILDLMIEEETKSMYCHAGFFIDDHTIIEAWWPVVRQVEVYEGDVFTPETPLTEEQIAKGIAYAKSKLGVKYNYTALPGFYLEDEFAWLKHNVLSDEHKEFCSELVKEIFLAMGLNLGEKEPASTSPGDLAICNKIKYSESIV